MLGCRALYVYGSPVLQFSLSNGHGKHSCGNQRELRLCEGHFASPREGIRAVSIRVSFEVPCELVLVLMRLRVLRGLPALNRRSRIALE